MTAKGEKRANISEEKESVILDIGYYTFIDIVKPQRDFFMSILNLKYFFIAQNVHD